MRCECGSKYILLDRRKIIDVIQKEYRCPTCKSKRLFTKDSRGNYEVVTDDVRQKINRPDSEGMHFWGKATKKYITGTFGQMVMEIR